MLVLLKNNALFASVADGRSGAKFKSLKDGADDSLSVGFRFKPRVELRTGFFSGFFKRSGMLSAYDDGQPFSKIEECSKRTPWNGSEQKLFAQISSEYNELGEPVLMGRANSTSFDAGGNGALLSGAILNTPENVGKIVAGIALSFFSGKARKARKEAGIKGDELAVIIEPMVWERSKDNQFYSPRMSMISKTETPYGGPRIWCVVGLAFDYMTNPTNGMAMSYPQKDMTLQHLAGGMKAVSAASMAVVSMTGMGWSCCRTAC